MEFRLNKIDTDIRRKLADEVKDDKVHSKRDKPIKNNMKRPFIKNQYKENERESLPKKFITIDGEKVSKRKVLVEAKKVDEGYKEGFSGMFIDKFK